MCISACRVNPASQYGCAAHDQLSLMADRPAHHSPAASHGADPVKTQGGPCCTVPHNPRLEAADPPSEGIRPPVMKFFSSMTPVPEPTPKPGGIAAKDRNTCAEEVPSQHAASLQQPISLADAMPALSPRCRPAVQASAGKRRVQSGPGQAVHADSDVTEHAKPVQPRASYVKKPVRYVDSHSSCGMGPMPFLAVGLLGVVEQQQGAHIHHFGKVSMISQCHTHGHLFELIMSILSIGRTFKVSLQPTCCRLRLAL